jgi:mannose-6-phosphate isomerase-like protein (cupin superfamily)
LTREAQVVMSDVLGTGRDLSHRHNGFEQLLPLTFSEILLAHASKKRKNSVMNIIVLSPGEGRTISLGPIQMVVQEDGTQTRGTLGVAEFTVPAHAPTPPPHLHHAHEEVFYVLEGELEFLAGAETVRASAGTFVMVPIGALHTFRNLTDRPARFLNTFTPPRYIHYFEEMSELLQAGVAPNSPQVTELMAHYDTEVIS